MASYTKLKNGDWGIRVEGQAVPGQQVTVTKRSGDRKVETIGSVVWSKGGVTICTIGRQQQTPSSRPPAKRQSTSRPRDGSNGKPGYCVYCDAHVAARAGDLLDAELLEDMDEFQLAERVRRESGRYGVACRDRAACKARCDANRAEAKKAREEAQKAAQAQQAVTGMASGLASAGFAAWCQSNGLSQLRDCIWTRDVVASTEIVVQELDRGQTYSAGIGLAKDGSPCAMETWYSSDDTRDAIWARPEVLEWALALAARRQLETQGRTPEQQAEKSRAWLAQYSGCAGSELHRWIASVIPETPVDLDTVRETERLLQEAMI